MDYSKLKGRPSWPFETIGVAIAFSPRLEDLLGEAQRFAKAFGAQLVLMHIGERTRTKEALLDDAFRNTGIDEKKVRMIWHDGEPVQTLLELCKLNIVDLLIIGALQKENMLRYYLGSVARKISRKAKCSVLMLTSPKKEGSTFRRIMVNGVENPKTVHTLNTAVYFGSRLDCKEVIVATEVTQEGFAMTVASDSTVNEASRLKKEIQEGSLDKVHRMVQNCRLAEGMSISEKSIKGKPGYAIRQYAETKKADLLAINSPDVKYGIIDRIFPHGMEYILEDMPCNVLVVHSRAQGK